MKKERKIYRSIFQVGPEKDEYELRNGDEVKILSWAEFEKLQSLMPDIGWIVVKWDKLPGRTHLDFNDAR